MITIETQISGGEIGRKLADDPEELFYALEAMAEVNWRDLGGELAEHCWGSSAEKIAALLKHLLENVEGAK